MPNKRTTTQRDRLMNTETLANGMRVYYERLPEQTVKAEVAISQEMLEWAEAHPAEVGRMVRDAVRETLGDH